MTDTQVKIGDKVIFMRDRDAQPVVTTVERLTPSGQIRIPEYPKSFRRNTWWEKNQYDAPGYDSASVYIYSDNKLAELQTHADEVAKDKAEKIAAKERERQERATEEAQQLAEIKTLCGNVPPIKYQQSLPDGSRFYVLEIPVNLDKRQKVSVVVLNCADKKDYDWSAAKEVAVITADVSIFRGDGGSSHLSTFRVANDDEAIWEAARYRYNDWD